MEDYCKKESIFIKKQRRLKMAYKLSKGKSSKVTKDYVILSGGKMVWFSREGGIKEARIIAKKLSKEKSYSYELTKSLAVYRDGKRID